MFGLKRSKWDPSAGVRIFPDTIFQIFCWDPDTPAQPLKHFPVTVAAEVESWHSESVCHDRRTRKQRRLFRDSGPGYPQSIHGLAESRDRLALNAVEYTPEYGKAGSRHTRSCQFQTCTENSDLSHDSSY